MKQREIKAGTIRTFIKLIFSIINLGKRGKVNGNAANDEDLMLEPKRKTNGVGIGKVLKIFLALALRIQLARKINEALASRRFSFTLWRDLGFPGKPGIDAPGFAGNIAGLVFKLKTKAN